MRGFAVFVGAALCACQAGDASPSRPEAKAVSSAAAAPAHRPQRAEPMLDVPEAALDARVGQMALAPTHSALEEARKNGVARAAFTYYSVRIDEVGVASSVVSAAADRVYDVPNALIVPLRAGERAKPLDVVLTSWASGAGMQRALVVPGGEASRPNVRYLDVALDSESGWGERAEILPENSFHVLRERGVPGTTLACGEGSALRSAVLLWRGTTELLALGFGGTVQRWARASCRDLPLTFAGKRGDHVLVPVLGQFLPGTVLKHDARVARSWVKYSVGSALEQQAFSVLDVLPQDPGPR